MIPFNGELMPQHIAHYFFSRGQIGFWGQIGGCTVFFSGLHWLKTRLIKFNFSSLSKLISEQFLADISITGPKGVK